MENYFNNAEGDATINPALTAGLTQEVPQLVLPTLPAITPLVVPATATKVDRATRIANEKAKVQSHIDRITVWQGKNAANIVKLSASVDKVNGEIAKIEADFTAANTTPDVNSTNNKIKHASMRLANLKTWLAKRQDELAKATVNKDRIVTYLQKANDHLGKVNAMTTSTATSTTDVVAVPATTSSADGYADPYSNADYSSADGFSVKTMDKKALVVGMVLGAGLMFLALKYRSKLGF